VLILPGRNAGDDALQIGDTLGPLAEDWPGRRAGRSLREG